LKKRDRNKLKLWRRCEQRVESGVAPYHMMHAQMRRMSRECSLVLCWGEINDLKLHLEDLATRP
jgi:hypothetical protein